MIITDVTTEAIQVEFRRVDGEWKISVYKPELTFVTPYEKGWAKQPFIEGVPGSLELQS